MNLQGIKMKKILLAATFFLTMCTTTMAQTSLFAGPYLGVNIGYNSFKSDGLVDNINGVSFGGFGGYRAPVSENVVIGLEAFVDVNQGKQDITSPGVGTGSINLNEAAGVNATAGLVIDKTMLYVLAGYGWLNVSNELFDTSDNGSGIRLGGGAEFKVSENIGIRLQTVWQDFDSASSIGGSAGVIFNF